MSTLHSPRVASGIFGGSVDTRMSRSHQSVRGRGGELLWAICEAQSSSPDTVQPAEWLHSEGSLLGQARHLVASAVSRLSGERGGG